MILSEKENTLISNKSGTQGSKHSYISFFSYKFYRNSYRTPIIRKNIPIYLLYFDIKLAQFWLLNTQSLTDLAPKSGINQKIML